MVTVTPWPFGPEDVEVRVKGRLLTRPSRSQAELDASLAAAEPVVLSYVLTRAR